MLVQVEMNEKASIEGMSASLPTNSVGIRLTENPPAQNGDGVKFHVDYALG